MKSIFLNNSMSLIKNYFPDYSNDDLDKIRYGLEGLYLTITKIVLILLLSFILNIFNEVIIIMFLFNFLRFFGFGVHSKSSNVCLVSSTFIFAILPIFVIKAKLNSIMIFFISLSCIISYLFFAPSDTFKRPLTNKKKRLIRKIGTTFVGVCYMLLALYFNNTFSNLIVYSLAIEAMIINPLTYKLLDEPYKNYAKVK